MNRTTERTPTTNNEKNKFKLYNLSNFQLFVAKKQNKSNQNFEYHFRADKAEQKNAPSQHRRVI